MPEPRHVRALLLLLPLWLAACGFRLAGTASLPPELDRIQLIARDLSAAQRERLVRRLERAGARVASEPAAGAVQLVVSLEALPDRRLVTSAGSGKKVERLSRRLEFSVSRADGTPLAPSRRLTQQRDITVDDDNLLASEEERRGVQRDLEQALFEQLIRQLARI